ncbi:hypothetical protein NQ317_018575 [Molorchus minor]|uniref:UDP-glucuronosyltransferase n=1 Tax=Molorchus minor TaxID=1323400 RepID=A0ABQ9JWT7_9CUCU|nr:hypothetical protein NQ317_018575 [Molorchus minor]
MHSVVSSSVYLWVILKYATGVNILLLDYVESPSHYIWNYAFVEGLMEKGHNITMLGPFVDKNNSTGKYHPIVLDGISEAIVANSDIHMAGGHWASHPLLSIKAFMDFQFISCNHSYHTNGFRTLWNYPDDFKFDLIITDMTLGPCLYPFIQKFGYPPTIGVTAYLLPSSVSDIFGNGVQPSFLPLFHVEFTENMDFSQRVTNFIYTHLETVLRQWYELAATEKLARRLLGTEVDDFGDIQRHISLVLANLDPTVHYARPLTPNIIPVGGLHVKDARKLPDDLRSIANNAKNGVILFCLGSNVHSSKLGNNVINNILSAFSQLKQTVVWKFEEKLENVPKNVFVRKWLPQNDILGHPNTKLFISHGGALSTYEAMYHGVPIIGMPFFLDQKTTVDFLVERKLALKVDPKNFTAEMLMNTIQEMLNNAQYSHLTKEYSSRMRDQPQTPLQRAVFWAEYVIRHKDAAHFLSPKSRDMSLFVSSSTDVILFLAVVLIVSLFVICTVVRKMYGCLFRSTKKEKSD